MKQSMVILVLVVLLLTLAGCAIGHAQSDMIPQSIGGASVEDALNGYSEAFANINYASYSGSEILPYVTSNWGQTWLDTLSSQYVQAYRNNKFVRKFTSAEISDVSISGDTATATLVIDSIQTKPDSKDCKSMPEKVTLKKIGGKWFIDKVEKK